MRSMARQVIFIEIKDMADVFGTKISGAAVTNLPSLPAPKRPGLLKTLGPGLVTGAADDDPSGIATYSQVGAQFGYGLAWTML